MDKSSKNDSIFNEDFDFNLNPKPQEQLPINQINWQKLIPSIPSFDEDLMFQLTQSLNEFCYILSDLNYIENINSSFGTSINNIGQ